MLVEFCEVKPLRNDDLDILSWYFVVSFFNEVTGDGEVSASTLFSKQYKDKEDSIIALNEKLYGKTSFAAKEGVLNGA